MRISEEERERRRERGRKLGLAGHVMSEGELAARQEHGRRLGEKNRIHGESKPRPTPEWLAWKNMRDRCLKSTNLKYPRYGARGITICERWKHSFANFVADMGRRPSSNHSIDRIDNDGNYEPSNCRWATWEEQNNNRGDYNILCV